MSKVLSIQRVSIPSCFNSDSQTLEVYQDKQSFMIGTKDASITTTIHAL